MACHINSGTFGTPRSRRSDQTSPPPRCPYHGVYRRSQRGPLVERTPQEAHIRYPRLPLLARPDPAVTGEPFEGHRRILDRWKQPIHQAGEPSTALAARVLSFPNTASRSWVPSRNASPTAATRLGAPHPDNARPRPAPSGTPPRRCSSTTGSHVTPPRADWRLADQPAPHHHRGRRSPGQCLIQHQPECPKWWTHRAF